MYVNELEILVGGMRFFIFGDRTRVIRQMGHIICGTHQSSRMSHRVIMYYYSN
jgi:hypothetical protein